ncbi:WD40-repeat-containing domain protein [Truncatella angustata]|uniref:WD40-repeat-containing domain protein n=1 Tax=Truncatella angustata TaxID=152316 RepID=A0A9P8USG4_9PEZI|nr:WD40-repeat-containing domain protein [Truncatella angustata]KAH6657627.1 WD40-repeat-containing domain protein [Truncatella angustata]
MESFNNTQEPDEGYSEHPLYPSSTEDHLSPARHSRDPAAFMAWLSPRLSTLNVEQRKQLAMALLAELPTTAIQDIVIKQLNPRLYIDFVSKLPAEICLKIFGYLDPVSLINVARCCREWYNLSLDHKLWEQLFYLEGWQAVPKEIRLAERRMKSSWTSSETIQPQRMRSSEYGHVYKKRAISDPARQETEHNAMELDRDDDTEMSGTGASLFGGDGRVTGSTSSSKTTSSVIQHLGGLVVESPSPMPVDMPLDKKGKGRATAPSFDSPVPSTIQASLPKSSLWNYHAQSGRYRINWQYLYIMRRRLEYNWEAGKYTNFQLPHPDYPQEGHKECVYSLQFDPDYVVSGSRDKTIRIWNLKTRRLVRKPLTGHRGSVLCLQFDADPEEDLIVSGSSDSDVIIWKFSTGDKIQVLDRAHSESVLNVKFDKRILVTCSKDRSIKIFNRKPLRAGDVGYPGNIDDLVGPVPINLKDYGYDDPLFSRLPVTQPFTEIGCLEGHGAAVNAVQIHGDEIVSASGDRHIKVWDWPQQICRRTFLGHHKGIACVQYDGRRIISGSSDNEVKVFDRETGLEVATLKGHVSLVRTVQAGFGDLPYSIEEDRSTAKAIDEEYFAAVKTGTLVNSNLSRGRGPNAGGRRPEDITAYGAKLPPGGGGGRYARIVSGSYDQSIIIWRRDKEGKWRRAHILQQAEAAANAYRQPSHLADSHLPSPSQSPAPSLHHNARPLARHPAPPPPPASAPPALESTGNLTHVEHPIHATMTPQTTMSYSRLIDQSVTQGPAALQNALTSFPTMLAYDSRIQGAIDQVPDAVTRSNLRQVVATAVQRTQLQQSRIRESVQQAMAAPLATQSASQAGSGAASALPPHLLPTPRPSRQSSRPNHTATTAAAPPLPPAPIPAHHPHIAQNDQPRVFKLQFDAHKIICCSQTSTIVGWDFCNGDPELEEVVRFFAPVE